MGNSPALAPGRSPRRESPASYRDSSQDDQLVMVTPADEPTGQLSKVAAHAGDGVLHRAFSVYVFDTWSRLLLQRRSDHKPLWPGYWSNSCCSHPRPGENTEAAAQRRLHEELGLPANTQLQFLFKFRYHARFNQTGSEHEVCSVYVARAQTPGHVNSLEVADYRYVRPEVLDDALSSEPENYTPWLRLAWFRMRAEHWQRISELCSQPL